MSEIKSGEQLIQELYPILDEFKDGYKTREQAAKDIYDLFADYSLMKE